MKLLLKTKTLWIGAVCTAAFSMSATAQTLPDFTLLDQNPSSDRSGEMVSFGDYRHQVSAYYFGASN